MYIVHINVFQIHCSAYLNNYLCKFSSKYLLSPFLSCPCKCLEVLALKYQWSTDVQGLNSSTDGPFTLTSIKSFKLCAVINGLNLFVVAFILLNPLSQATVDTSNTGIFLT
jgi:hypothetical protein